MLIMQIVQESTDLQPVPTVEKLNLIALALKGGIFMIPLAILFVIGIYLLFERYFTVIKASKSDPNFVANIKDMVSNGNITGAGNLCQRTDTPIARMLGKGIMRLGKPMKDIEVSIENQGRLEVYRLERGISILATISGAAPMIGFLGTVTGMIRAFFNMSKAGNNIDIGLLSGGIYEAMITTVAGLIVGIFAYISYNSISSLIQKVTYKMESAAIEFMDHLQEPA